MNNSPRFEFTLIIMLKDTYKKTEKNYSFLVKYSLKIHICNYIMMLNT